jgi:8-oxo-dGTP pyrophosphatase MutT (NUDIX family)
MRNKNHEAFDCCWKVCEQKKNVSLHVICFLRMGVFFFREMTDSLVTIHVEPKFIEDKDRFGNPMLKFISQPLEAELAEILANHKIADKAVATYGLRDDVVQRYNLKFGAESGLLHYWGMTSLSKKSCYVLYHESNCPKLLHGRIFAASCFCLVQHAGENYFLVIKDRTKPMETLAGGTAEQQEVGSSSWDKVDFRAIAKRELLEETGIKCDTVEKLAVLRFASSYFGIANIEDSCHVFYCPLQESACPKNLFQAGNYDECSKTYLLRMSANSEIDYIRAYKLTAVREQLDAPKGMSSIAWAIAQRVDHSHKADQNLLQFQDLTHAVKNLPPALKHFQMCYQAIHNSNKPSSLALPQPRSATATVYGCRTLLGLLRTGTALSDDYDQVLLSVLLQGRSRDAIEYTGQFPESVAERDVLGFGPAHYAMAGQCLGFMRSPNADLVDWQQTSLHGLTAAHVFIESKKEESGWNMLKDLLLSAMLPVSIAVRARTVVRLNLEQFDHLMHLEGGILEINTHYLLYLNDLARQQQLQELAKKQRNLCYLESCLHTAKTNPASLSQLPSPPDLVEEEEKQRLEFKDNLEAELNFGTTKFNSFLVDVNYLVWQIATDEERQQILRQTGGGIVITGCINCPDESLSSMSVNGVRFGFERFTNAILH